MPRKNRHPEASKGPTRIRYGAWIWRVITWDGILPFVMFAWPFLVAKVLAVLGMAAAPMQVVMYAMMFAETVRAICGYLLIDKNSCSAVWRERQRIALAFGITLLAGFDVVMAEHVLEQQIVPQEWKCLTCGALYLVSLPFLIFSLYPGRESVPSTRVGNWHVEV